MKALEDSVRSIEMEGLVWGASKLVPIGYGIRKLQITLVVGSSFTRSKSTCNSWSHTKYTEDELVSLDDLQEKIAESEEYVQSSDVAAMQSKHSRLDRVERGSDLISQSCKQHV
jgi:elongation factor 1-beta